MYFKQEIYRFSPGMLHAKDKAFDLQVCEKNILKHFIHYYCFHRTIYHPRDFISI